MAFLYNRFLSRKIEQEEGEWTTEAKEPTVYIWIGYVL